MSFIAKSDILCEVSIKEGQPTPKLRWLALFDRFVKCGENFKFWGMESMDSLFTLIILIALISIIVFGILWFRVRKDKDNEKYAKNKKFTLISLAVLVIAIIGLQMTPSSDSEDDTAEPKSAQTSGKDSSEADEESDSELSEKALKKLEVAINGDLDSEDAGNTSWSWDKDEEAWVATLDSNSEMYGDMQNGQVSVWNSYVREVKEISKTAKKNDQSNYSTFKLRNPDDTDRLFLIVEDGQVKYNVGEDLN